MLTRASSSRLDESGAASPQRAAAAEHARLLRRHERVLLEGFLLRSLLLCTAIHTLLYLVLWKLLPDQPRLRLLLLAERLVWPLLELMFHSLWHRLLLRP